MRPRRGVSALTERLYASVGDPEALRLSLACLGGMIRAEAAAVQEYDFSRQRGQATPLLRFGEREIRGYLEHYSATNVWMLHGRHKVLPGHILLSHEMFPDERLENTEWFTDFLKPESLFHSTGVVLGMDEGVSTTATFLRPKGGGRFGAADVAALRHLAPHLRRVFALHRQFLAASIRAADARHVMDCLPVGVIVVDAAMRIDSANRSGRDIVSCGAGLKVQGDCLLAPPSQNRALKALVAAALATPPGKPTVLKLARPGDQPPLEVSASPLPQPLTLWRAGNPRAAVFVLSPGAREPLSPDVLASLYQFTPAEARLASLVAGGAELKDIAETLGVSRNTVKTQLRNVFAKTDTRRQSELIHRILTSPARFQHGS